MQRNHLIRLLSVLGMAVFCLCTPSAFALQMPQGATEDDLQRTLDAATPGETIDLQFTITLTKTLTIRKSVNLRGTGTLDLQLPPNNPRFGVQVSANHVSIAGLTFDGSKANAQGGAPPLTTPHYAMLILGAQQVEIKDCKFLNLTHKGAPAASSTNASLNSEYGIYIEQSKHVKIESNKFEEISGVAVFAKYANDLWITDNIVNMLSTGHSLYGITLYSAIDGAVIRGNVIRGGEMAAGGAINVMAVSARSRNIIISGNTLDKSGGFSGGNARIRVISVDNCVISSNMVIDTPTVAGQPANQVVYIYVGEVSGSGFGPSQGILISANILKMNAVEHVPIDTTQSLNVVQSANVISPYTAAQ